MLSLLCACGGGVEAELAVPPPDAGDAADAEVPSPICDCALVGTYAGIVPIEGDYLVCTPGCIPNGQLRLYGPDVPYCSPVHQQLWTPYNGPTCTAYGCCHWKTTEQLSYSSPDGGVPDLSR